MNSVSVLDPTLIKVGVEAREKLDALEQLAFLLQEQGAVRDAELFLADVLQREADGPTGIGNGVAIPHGKSRGVTRTCIAACTLAHPIAWESLDDQPVSVILLFAVDSSDVNANREHLALMAGVAKALAHDEVNKQLNHAATPQDILRALEPYL